MNAEIPSRPAQPLVSVVVPVCNGGTPYLLRALDSRVERTCLETGAPGFDTLSSRGRCLPRYSPSSTA